MFFVLIICLIFAGCGSVSVDPDDSGAYAAGMEALQNADYDTAMADFKEAAETDGRLAESLRAQGIVYFDKGDYAHALDMFEQSLDSMRVNNPDFTEDVNYYIAESLTRLNKTEEATALYEKLAQGTKPYLANAMLGRIFMKNGETQKAEMYFDQSVEEKADYAVCLMIYESCCEAHLEADGTKYLEKALEYEPQSPKDHADLGVILNILEDYNNAKEHLQIAVDSGYVQAASVLGDLYLDEGNISAARALYENEIRSGAWPADGYNGLALCEIAAGNAETALRYIEQGKNCNDDSMKKSLLFNEVVAYETMLDFDTALLKANEFLLQYPNDEQMKREQKFLSV